MSWDQVHRTQVTILCERYWPDAHGGLEWKMWNLSRALASAGCTVRVVTGNRANAPPHQNIQPNLTVQRVQPANAGPFWRCASLVCVGWWYRLLRSVVGRGSIWTSDPRMVVASMLAGRINDVVYQPIGCQKAMHHLSCVYPHIDTMRSTAVLRGLDRWAYRIAPRIIFESHNAREQFQGCYGQRSGAFVVHNGVEPAVRVSDTTGSEARRRWGLTERHWVVGYVGRLDPCKDIGFLFRAVAADPDRHRTRLLLVGQGPDRHRLERLAAQYGLSDRIVWAGRLDEPAVAFGAMDVMVLPSVYEIFGNVILEAMGAGVPVIGRRRDANPHRPVLTANEELIRHGRTGLLVDPHDPDDLAGQLRRLRDDPDLLAAMSRNCRRWASGRSWRVVVQRYFRVMNRTGEDQTGDTPCHLDGSPGGVVAPRDPPVAYREWSGLSPNTIQESGAPS